MDSAGSNHNNRQQLEPLSYGDRNDALQSSGATLPFAASNQASAERPPHYHQQTTAVGGPPLQQVQPHSVVVAKPDQDKEKDWLLDPVNLYMRGMAQKREQMRKLQN